MWTFSVVARGLLGADRRVPATRKRGSSFPGAERRSWIASQVSGGPKSFVPSHPGEQGIPRRWIRRCSPGHRPTAHRLPIGLAGGHDGPHKGEDGLRQESRNKYGRGHVSARPSGGPSRGQGLVRTKPTEPRSRTQSSGMLISLLRQASPIDYIPYRYELFK